MPTYADVDDIDAIWLDEHDDELNPMGSKGIGEIGIVGMAAAVGNAVFHATGHRFRRLPIRLDDILEAGSLAMASYEVNKAGVAKARQLIDAHQYVLDSVWGDAQPSTEDENRFLE